MVRKSAKAVATADLLLIETVMVAVPFPGGLSSPRFDHRQVGARHVGLTPTFWSCSSVG
jgi:hypothetical protein